MTRIGPQMKRVVSYVRNHPGRTKYDAAMATWCRKPNRNNAYAYAPVNRAIEAGLIRAKRVHASRYELTPV